YTSGSVAQHTFVDEGVFSVTLTVTDDMGERTAVSQEITVVPPNTAPVSENLEVVLDEDSSQNISLVATDIDNDEITFSIESQPTHGEILLSDGVVIYTPESNYYGVDSFSYSASDGIEVGNTATVSILINPINDLPEAVLLASSQSGEAPLEIHFDASQSFDVDGDDLSYTWSSSNGVFATGMLATHTFDQAGEYLVTLTVSDTTGYDTDEILIHVAPYNIPPTAQNQSATTLEDQAVDITLLAQDPENQPLSYSIITQPSNGTLTLNGNIARYIPNSNYNGQDSFTFSASDSQNSSNVATVTLTITEVNDLPIAFFNTTPATGRAPLVVSFDASLSYDVEGELQSYLWDFGDGSTGLGALVNHIYQNPGEYTVVLQVIDQEGASASTQATVMVMPQNQNEIASYDFNSSSGTLLQDISGNNNHGIIDGATWSNGKSGNALYFDGTDDSVNIGNVNLSGNQMTISAWIYSNGFLDDDRIISKSTGQATNNHYWMISIANGNKLRFRLKTGTKTTKTIIANSATPTNQWVHVVATYDGSKMKLYRDGVLVASTNLTGTIATNSVDAFIGSNIGGYSPWNGKIDDLHILDKALNQQEILDLYHQ
ncbi:tandem-95 repeat protein, partial [Candidatus Woesebacteria bacterium]|nr:tandem-95 repeat protein [Candidatus Woesebacteria bacterium]